MARERESESRAKTHRCEEGNNMEPMNIQLQVDCPASSQELPL